MKTGGLVVLLVLVLALLIVLANTLYTLQEWQQVVITRFGEPVGDPITQPGLHVKVHHCSPIVCV